MCVVGGKGWNKSSCKGVINWTPSWGLSTSNFKKEILNFPVSLSLDIDFDTVLSPPPPFFLLGIISHDRWAWRRCLNSPAPKISIPVFRSTLFSPPFHLQPCRQPTCSLARPLSKVWGRGGALIHRLSCLPFYCFGEDHIFPSSLSHPRSCFLSCHWSNQCPTSPFPGHTASSQQPQQGQRERGREREIEKRAQAQCEVLRSASLASSIVVIYPPAWRFPSSTPFSCCVIFWLSRRQLCFCPALSFLSFLCWFFSASGSAVRASLHECDGSPARMRIPVAACSCHNPVGCSS